MEDLILVFHGLVVGSALYLGFYLLFFMLGMLIDDRSGVMDSSLMDKCMDKMPFFLYIIAMFAFPFIMFILSFTPMMLALTFGPAYVFEVSSVFQCNGIVLGSRTGATEINACTKGPVWIGVILSFCLLAYFRIFRNSSSD
ncbi:MAG: hypothetical protein ACTIDY_01555 [Halomonadaceae bacterium]|uniref:Uncharacterized protein n=1 Tax=Halomonas colorata TaxID=2742615 RepID=A0ABR9FTW4_9GAMM|nr:hypothetical protein [Halomonas colorata]MBE0462092.1 hypothetical protein [Halomonas colorata]